MCEKKWELMSLCGRKKKQSLHLHWCSGAWGASFSGTPKGRTRNSRNHSATHKQLTRESVIQILLFGINRSKGTDRERFLLWGIQVRGWGQPGWRLACKGSSHEIIFSSCCAFLRGRVRWMASFETLLPESWPHACTLLYLSMVWISESPNGLCGLLFSCSSTCMLGSMLPRWDALQGQVFCGFTAVSLCYSNWAGERYFDFC